MSTREKATQDDLELLFDCLPPRIVAPLRERGGLGHLLEVVIDLARPPEARFPDGDVVLDPAEVGQEDLDFVIARIGQFGDDNRSGIERTLHRVSAIRNRKGRILGITCRVGRAVFGAIQTIEDLAFSGKNILLLGRPGVGKTTMLREVARALADGAKKRVIVVDTSNEIAGDGDIPHPAIGHARRMQVPASNLQHSVMIEAVENHMPQVIIIDEMSTELEAAAARTIAERGVQLVATAHGNTLDNLILNPTLSDLVGGIQTVTLGDDEARYRGTQKTVLERKAPPTFDAVVEIQSWDTVAVHDGVARVVDSWLRGYSPAPEVRRMRADGSMARGVPAAPAKDDAPRKEPQRAPTVGPPDAESPTPRVFLFGVGRDKVEQASADAGVAVEVVNDLRDADLVLTTKSHYKRGSRVARIAEESGRPIHVVRKNSAAQVQQFLRGAQRRLNGDRSVNTALQEAHEAAQRVLDGEDHVDLSSQRAYVRRLQHLLAQKYNLASLSSGADPHRHVRLLQR